LPRLRWKGLPLMRRWHVVNTAGKLLSPAAEALRYFVLERGEAHLAAMFTEHAGARLSAAGRRPGRASVTPAASGTRCTPSNGWSNPRVTGPACLETAM
jgi:hypothetical protein